MTRRSNRIFWAISFQVATIHIFLGVFGPGQTLLRNQQHTSLTIASLHGTAMGISSMLAGLAGPHVVHRFGRTSTSWIALGIFSGGVLIFVFSPPVQLTLFATLVAGFGTSLGMNSMVAQLVHQFPIHPSKAVSQTTGIGSAGYVIGILSAGAIARTSLNWRLGVLVVVPLALLLYLFTRRLLASDHTPEVSGRQRGSLNYKFWISWVGLTACLATEFAITFWAAALLKDRIGSTAAIATICIVAVGVGMGLGRWFGPELLKGLDLDNQLKTTMAIAFIGFAAFWYSHLLWVSVLALLVAGLGMSMQYALATTRLIAFSEKRPDLAMGRGSLAGGIAIAGAPLILGALGDNLGISRAYLMVPVLILIALITIITIPSGQPTLQESV